MESVGALALELHYDKNLILEAYLNEVYLGQRGPVAISGVGDASRFFFGTDVGALDLPRCALVAGMIRNPGQYNPRLHPDEARARRDLVLRLMHERDVIDGSAFHSALAAPLGIADETPGPNRSRWIEDYLAQEIRRIAPEAIPSRAGFSIFTTFDPRVQSAAEGALREGLARLERRVGKSDGQPLEGAVVVLRPSDGSLLALVGGRDYGRSQFNRAVSSRRSPGSTFKPFVFLAGFERGVREPDFNFTAASELGARWERKRSVRTCVLPQPAPAESAIETPRAATARCCWSVKRCSTVSRCWSSAPTISFPRIVPAGYGRRY